MHPVEIENVLEFEILEKHNVGRDTAVEVYSEVTCWSWDYLEVANERHFHFLGILEFRKTILGPGEKM